jgi:hypothetical protein
MKRRLPMRTLQAPHVEIAAAAAVLLGLACPFAQAAPADSVAVTLVNPLAAARPHETVALAASALAKALPGFDLKQALVTDGRGAAVLSQLVDEDGDDVPDQLVFQADFGPRETKTFQVISGKRSPAADFKVYGRFVRERHDDFAWENDRVAHRVYGPALETYPKEALVSSGIDVWVKRVPRLVVNEWYMTDDYHQDHGEGADFYSVGKSRGCGGVGLWADGALAVSHNFTTSRVLANGPIRLIFELTYAPWGAAGARVSERKRVTLDAGSLFNQIESTFTAEAGGDGAQAGPASSGVAPAVAIGIAKHPGNVESFDRKLGWRGVWEPLDGGKSGHLGCAVLLKPGAKADAAETPAEYLLLTPMPARGPLAYYVGTSWDQAAPLADLAAWHKQAQQLSAQLASPIAVKLERGRSR